MSEGRQSFLMSEYEVGKCSLSFKTTRTEANPVQLFYVLLRETHILHVGGCG